MARPGSEARGRRRPSAWPPATPAVAPFVLAASRAPGVPGHAEQRRLTRLVALWDQLSALEAKAWAGKLSARRLLRLQRLRVTYAALFHEAGV